MFHYKVGPLLRGYEFLRLDDVRMTLEAIKQIEFCSTRNFFFEVTISHNLGGIKLVLFLVPTFLDDGCCSLTYLLDLLVLANVIVLNSKKLDFIRLRVLQNVGR